RRPGSGPSRCRPGGRAAACGTWSSSEGASVGGPLRQRARRLGRLGRRRLGRLDLRLGHLRLGPSLVGAPRGSLTRRAATSTTPPPSTARATWPAAGPTTPAHRPEALAVGLASAAALAGGRQPLGGAASPPGLVLVTQPRIALGEALVALGHD